MTAMDEQDGLTSHLTLAQLCDIVRSALSASGASDQAANSLADAFIAAEADGLVNHGVARLPMFCEHLLIGKIKGQAVPVVSKPSAGVVVVDAAHGLAHPAIDAGLPELLETARRQGVAALAIRRAYSAHVIGYHTERIAAQGFVALGFANAPASIAPAGGKAGVFGTNPISFAIPRHGNDPIVIDQAASVIAKSEIVDRAAHDDQIPLGWALDVDGNPTTSAKDALKGTMMPAGGYKGVNIALLAETLAAVTAGGTLAIDTAPFADINSGPMELGQFFLAIDAQAISGGSAFNAIDLLASAFIAQGARLPGSRRLENRRRAQSAGVSIRKDLHEKILSYTNNR
jgi:(2R)-3-sulfolactate dehydrogenase (NADP+)